MIDKERIIDTPTMPAIVRDKVNDSVKKDEAKVTNLVQKRRELEKERLQQRQISPPPRR